MKNKWNTTVKRIAKAVDRINKAEGRVIENRLKLGQVILDLMLDASYGERVIPRLAYDLSALLGYKVLHQRLYEYARAARVFSDINAVYERAGTRDVTWQDVMILCKMRKTNNTEKIYITLDPEKDRDLLKFKAYKPKTRNEFLKEALRIGIKNLKHMKKLPPLTEVKGIVTFAKNGRIAA
jgi:hypothetical protein